MISRDRAGAYADGARQGAPAALQVADRFHLLSNAGATRERVLGREHAALRTAAAEVDARAAANAAPPASAPLAPEPPARRPTRAQQEQTERRARRLGRYEAVLALHQDGLSQGVIGAQLGMSRKTVRRFLRSDSFPERCGIPELRSFVAGIRRDQAAVEAALHSPWSNGQTEGQINRLKTLKRQMYGRAKLDLLRQRFLAAA